MIVEKKELNKILQNADEALKKVRRVEVFDDKLIIIFKNYDTSQEVPYNEKFLELCEKNGIDKEVKIPNKKAVNRENLENLINSPELRGVKAMFDGDNPTLRLVFPTGTTAIPYTKKNLYLLEQRKIFRSSNNFDYNFNDVEEIVAVDKLISDGLDADNANKVNTVLSFEKRIPGFNKIDNDIVLTDECEKYRKQANKFNQIKGKLLKVNSKFFQKKEETEEKEETDSKEKNKKEEKNKKFVIRKVAVGFALSAATATAIFAYSHTHSKEYQLKKKYDINEKNYNTVEYKSPEQKEQERYNLIKKMLDHSGDTIVEQQKTR